MEVHQDRLQLLAEKRKWQTELENKCRQLEDERRALQHLKSKALRERWLLEGAPTSGPDQDRVRSQLAEDEAKTRNLEESIRRLEQEVLSLETGSVSQPITHPVVMPDPVPAVEVKGQSKIQLVDSKPPAQMIQDPVEIKGHKNLQISQSRDAPGEFKKAMYSVEIKVERDKLTGETRVLSTNTKLPVDLSDQGVKVYEDEQKVVHEINGEDSQLLTSSDVEELIHKADEASLMSPPVTIKPSLPTGKVPRDADLKPELGPSPMLSPVPSRVPGTSPTPAPHSATEITGLETKERGESSVAEASAENPVTMVFMGYQDVEDEDETRKVLGLQGTVKAELVLLDDTNGKVDPPASASAAPAAARPTSADPHTSAAPLPDAQPISTKSSESMVATNGEAALEGSGVVGKKKKPCKCCSIM
ncbi:paralemmin 1a isoform X1 [Cyprinodon tularosa]|uniref:paralemmin 1a isoform X1 n=1 Tax=Cyprinodon tularosa TaxID=77115 RepID=UPI0018E25A77|nr:paralemmin 1a isoform X1 [Cyprinodon tularosa]